MPSVVPTVRGQPRQALDAFLDVGPQSLALRKPVVRHFDALGGLLCCSGMNSCRPLCCSRAATSTQGFVGQGLGPHYSQCSLSKINDDFETFGGFLNMVMMKGVRGSYLDRGPPRWDAPGVLQCWTARPPRHDDDERRDDIFDHEQAKDIEVYGVYY